MGNDTEKLEDSDANTREDMSNHKMVHVGQEET